MELVVTIGEQIYKAQEEYYKEHVGTEESNYLLGYIFGLKNDERQRRLGLRGYGIWTTISEQGYIDGEGDRLLLENDGQEEITKNINSRQGGNTNSTHRRLSKKGGFP